MGTSFLRTTDPTTALPVTPSTLATGAQPVASAWTTADRLWTFAIFGALAVTALILSRRGMGGITRSWGFGVSNDRSWATRSATSSGGRVRGGQAASAEQVEDTGTWSGGQWEAWADLEQGTGGRDAPVWAPILLVVGAFAAAAAWLVFVVH